MLDEKRMVKADGTSANTEPPRELPTRIARTPIDTTDSRVPLHA